MRHLALLYGLVTSGVPIHPAQRDRLAAAIGELSPAEQEHLDVLVEVRRTRAAWHREQFERLAALCSR